MTSAANAHMDRLKAKLAAHGISEEGRSFCLKALDPASSLPNVGIPDTSSSCVMRPEYRAQGVVSPPLAGTFWDTYMWMPPGDTVGVWYATAPQVAGPVNFGNVVAPANAMVGYIPLQACNNVPGGTYHYAIKVNGIAPTVTGYTALCTVRQPASLIDSFRTTYRSITIEQDAAMISCQGVVWAGQVPTVVRTRSGAVVPDLGAVGADGYMCTTVTVALPMNESDLMQSCPGAYTGTVKDGLYLVTRLSGPTQPFANVDHPSMSVGSDGLANSTYLSCNPVNATYQYPAQFYGTTADNFSGTVPWPFAIANAAGPHPNRSQGVIFDTSYDNANTGVIIMRGMSSSGGGGGGPTFGSSLRLKVLVGLETIPRPTSVDRIYGRPPAHYEPRALEAYYAVAGSTADAYPAEYNALGAILPVIGSALTALWPTIRSVGNHFLGGSEPPRVEAPQQQAPPPVRRAVQPPRPRVQMPAKPRPKRARPGRKQRA